MKIRTIKPDFFRSDDIAALTPTARLLFIGLWCYADDNGVCLESIQAFAADIFLGDFTADPQGTKECIERDYQALADQGLIIRFEADG